MTTIPAGWKLVEALRESLLWTASSLAAVGKEQDLITLEGRKRTIGEILDEANAALNAHSPDCAAPAAPVSTVEQDEQPARLTDGYWWPTTASQLKRVAAELIRAADAMGAADDDDEEADLILSVVPTGAICLDEDAPEGRNLHPVLAVSIADYADEGAYPVDPLDPTGGRLEEAPAAGDALDAERLDWLEQHDGRFYNKDRISSIVGTGFLVAGDEQGTRHQTVRAAIDAAIAAQRKGDA